MASARTPTPEPAPERSPEPTPRRSSRLKKVDGEETPRPKKSTRGKGSVKDAAVETSAPKDTGRRRRKATAEPTSPEHEAPPPMPPVPTITETAPSPSEKSSSTYQPRAEGEMPRQQSSLRARTEKTKRAHGSSAHGSRATSPNAGGRFSAREEDLPDMEELEQTKISLPSFSGVSFGNFGLPPPPAPQKSDSSLSKPAAPSTSNLGVPARGPLSRLNASRPRASSPLAAGSIVAEPDSPETSAPAPPKEAVKPNENGFFSLSGSKAPAPAAPSVALFGGPPSSSDSSKKTFSFGLGKPSGPGAPTPAPASESGEVPNFFGRKSAPDSGTSTPVVAAPTPFSFGAPKPTETSSTKAAPFSFGKPSTPAEATPTPAPAPLGSFNFGSKPAEASKPASTPAPIGSFNFGGAASTASEPAAKKPAPIGSFSFGAKADEKAAVPASSTPSFVCFFPFSDVSMLTPSSVPPSPPRRPQPQTPSVRPLRSHLHQLLLPLPPHSRSVRQTRLSLPKHPKLHSLSALAPFPLLSLQRPHLLLPPPKSLLHSPLVNPPGPRHQPVVRSEVGSAPKLPRPRPPRHPLHSRLVLAEQAALPRRSVVHLIKALDLVRNPPHSVSVRMAIPLLQLPRRLSVSDPAGQLPLPPVPTHLEVNLLNPLLSGLVLVPHPPPLLLPILSVLLLSPLRLQLRLLPEGSASILAAPTTHQVLPLDSVIPHLLLLPLSVSVNPMLRLRHRLPLLASRLAELVMVLQHLLSLHSALETPRLLRMEVRPRLVSLKGSDLEVLRLGLRHLPTAGLVWVWTQVIRLVVLVEGRSSLSGGVRSVSIVCRGRRLRSRQG